MGEVGEGQESQVGTRKPGHSGDPMPAESKEELKCGSSENAAKFTDCPRS